MHPEEHPSFHLIDTFRRVWKLLLEPEKRKIGYLSIGVLINSFLEILGLAAVLPVVSVVINPSQIHDNPWLAKAFSFTSSIGLDTDRKFLMTLSVLLIFAFLFKAIFNLLLNLVQTRFSYNIGHRISGLMWDFHFTQSLERMRYQPTGKVMSEINGWPISFANNFIVRNMQLVNELFVIVVICIGLVIYNPIVLLSVSMLILLGSLLIRTTTKNRLAAYSRVKQKNIPESMSLINSAIRGFLEVLSFQASDSIRDLYLGKTKKLYRIEGNTLVLNMAPAKLYEVLAVSAVALSILVSLLLGDTNEKFLNLLILLALSAYRIMPSMTRINSQIMMMRSQYFLLEVIESALNQAPKNQPVSTEKAPNWEQVFIQLEDVRLEYQALEEPVLERVSCIFEPGKIHAIVGPSGSGKSTLVNAILGLHPLSKGRITVGDDLNHSRTLGDQLSLSEWLEHVGYLSQNPFLFEGNLRHNLTLHVASDEIDEAWVRQLITRLGLDDALGENPLDFRILEAGNNLSGGQQQRVAILRALRVQRAVLILDEATSALDGEKRDAVFELLRERADAGTNVLLITHDLTLAKQCDTILNLIGAGQSPTQIIQSNRQS